ncbi:MAG: hypothetical protein C4K60_17700 [Ideonella sp. MAG2]|nr:MAG: hypothetical protein C4K60_17700 [Ideonella sp. MAG2]
MVIIPALSLGYQGVPKVGTTSMYSWLYEHLLQVNGTLVDEVDLKSPNHKRLLFTAGKAGNVLVPNTAEAVHPYASAFKFAFTRDPVKRFVSMYRNRVVHHRELGSRTSAAARMRQHGLAVDPSIDLLVERWEDYRSCSVSIAHHARTQLDFLGPDLSVYDRLIDLSGMATVLEEVRKRWRSTHLASLAERRKRLTPAPA